MHVYVSIVHKILGNFKYLKTQGRIAKLHGIFFFFFYVMRLCLNQYIFTKRNGKVTGQSEKLLLPHSV